jgi:hypothetical protein
MVQPIHFRPESEDLRAKIVARAEEKGISVNEWLNRAATFGVTNGGKLKITTVVQAEF